MTREQFEAAAWPIAHRLVSIDRQEAADAMDELLRNADAYAAGDSDGVCALRRDVLEAAAR